MPIKDTLCIIPAFIIFIFLFLLNLVQKVVFYNDQIHKSLKISKVNSCWTKNFHWIYKGVNLGLRLIYRKLVLTEENIEKSMIYLNPQNYINIVGDSNITSERLNCIPQKIKFLFSISIKPQ